jgi:uncharacterized protein YidB (DUF937 family)
MSMFDDVLKQVAGAAAGNPGAGAGLEALGLDPQHAGLAEAVMGMLSHEQSGGIGGLARQFEQAGLGSVVNSWISTGTNQPVSAQQLESVLGSGVLQQLAQKAGLNAQSVGPLLTTLLPVIIDKLTPQGQVPQQTGGGLLELGLQMLRGGRN